MIKGKTINKEPEVKIALAWDAFRYAFEGSFEQKIPVLTNPKDVQDYDLVIFSGGEDISPKFYSGDYGKAYGINEERDDFEFSVFENASMIGKKMLGVCRGHQLLNALKGAHFIQDLRMVENVNHPGEHKIEKKDSKFISHFTTVNSMHHQGILSGAGRLYHTSFYGKCKNGGYVVESSENESIVTVQFHPEFMRNNESEEFFRKIKEWAKEKVFKKDVKELKKKSNWDFETFMREVGEDIPRRIETPPQEQHVPTFRLRDNSPRIDNTIEFTGNSVYNPDIVPTNFWEENTPEELIEMRRSISHPLEGELFSVWMARRIQFFAEHPEFLSDNSWTISTANGTEISQES